MLQDTLPMSPQEAVLLSPLQLAYLGDAVWSLMVRESLTRQKLNLRHMHTEAVDGVNAAAQAGYLQKILPRLTPEEAAVAQRGRNAHAHHAPPRNQDPADYRESTAFEALFGYLYLTGQAQRMRELFALCREEDPHARDKAECRAAAPHALP